MSSFKTTQIASTFPLLIHLHFLFFLLINIILCPSTSHGCHEEERRALLSFKSSLEDPSNRLNSWQESPQHQNCCEWHGIQCSSESLHVISIDLRNIVFERFLYGTKYFQQYKHKHNLDLEDHLNISSTMALNTALRAVRGKSSSFIQNITRLEYLDLGFNDFHESDIILPLPYLKKLTYLDLSFTNISASISTQFTNFSSLQYLDLSCTVNLVYSTSCFQLSSTKWVRGLVNLKVLRLSGFDLSSQENADLTSSIYNLSRLQHLDLSNSNITSSIHSSISNLKELNFLDLSNNNFQGPIPLSICEIYPLQHLVLLNNNITGILPSCIMKLQNLRVLDISGNSIAGNFSLVSLINELSLSTLGLSSNTLTVVVEQHMDPSKFQLQSLQLGSCNMKGFIPSFICHFSHLNHLNLSHNSLIGAIPSCISELKLVLLDLSNNEFSGPLPLPPRGVRRFDLSHNKLDGEISIESGKRLSSAHYILLNDNKLSGSIPFTICRKEHAKSYERVYINLSNNRLSGTIPTSIGHCRSLFYLNLGNNNVSGNVPNELGQAKSLQHFHLCGNNLNGAFPNSVLKLFDLQVLNLNNNNFKGIIPTGLGSLNHLKVISLRSNMFSGSLPEEIFNFRNLLVLDLSMNNISGSIPKNIGNFMSQNGRASYSFSPRYFSIVQFQLFFKGIWTQFEQLCISGIDLSCNTLDGNIPEEFGLLNGLVMLNLSNNQFSNSIPASIGNMSSLESLDLSHNRLSGHIPQDLASIDSLGFLNISDNNLSGRIPRGNHFDTLGLDNFIFNKNGLLCGFPTDKNCTGDHNISTTTGTSNKFDKDGQEVVKEDDKQDKLLLYAIVALGFIVGFWGLFFGLLSRKLKWWFPYWRGVNSVAVRMVECISKDQ